MIKIICEYCGVVVTGNRNVCQNCGARVYGIQSFSDIKSTDDYVYSTLFKDERKMKLLRFIGLILVAVGILLLFFGFIFPNFMVGMIIIGVGIGLICGGGMLIYQNVKEFE